MSYASRPRGFDDSRRGIRCAVLAVLCVAVWSLTVETAAQPARVFARYTPEQGLSSPNVTDILQDRTGFIWIATEEGLNRFDGQHFTVFRHDPADSTSLSDSWTTALAEDEQGRLWVGTRHGGLNRFDGRGFVRYPFAQADSTKGIARSDVSALLPRGHELWIGVYGGGVSRLDLKTGRYLHYDRRTQRFASFTSNDVMTLTRDREGFVWVGKQENGVTRIDPATHAFRHYHARRRDFSTLTSDRAHDIVQDRYGYVWIGTSSGLNRMDPRTGRVKQYIPVPDDPTSLSHHVVWSVFEDSRGNLWVGTWGGGLNLYHRETDSFTHFRHNPNDDTSLPSDVVLTIFEDRSGLLWFGTDSGIATYHPAGEGIFLLGHRSGEALSLANQNVLSVRERPQAPGTVWVGTSRGGLHRLDLHTRQLERIDLSGVDAKKGNDLIVHSVAESRKGVIWVGTLESGLLAYDPRTRRITRYAVDASPPYRLNGDDDIYTVLVDRQDHVWVGTGYGLTRIDEKTGALTFTDDEAPAPRRLSHSGVEALLEDRQGRIWIGTQGGLNRLDPATGRVTSYLNRESDRSSLSHNYVYALTEDRAGRVWIGTYDGLNRYDPKTDRFVRFTTNEGLSSSVITGLATCPDGSVWMTTARSLSRVDPRSNRVVNFTRADGLPTTHFNRNALACSQRGELLLAGPDGLAVFHPRIFEQERYQPTLVLTAFRKFGEVVSRNLSPGTRLQLNHRDTYFSFDFALLDFTNPAEHRYQYRLEGFDGGWQHANGPVGTAHYQNDGRAGTFTFRVRGMDSRGRTSERTLTVVIVPPWWRTLWFRILSVTSIAALGAAGLWYGYRRKQQEQAERRRLMTESAEQNRALLARELHDVPLQNLYSVRHRLEIISREAPLNGHASDLDATRALLEQTAEDLRRICGELRPPTLGPFGLSKAIRAHLRTFEESHPEIDFEADLTPDGTRLPEPVRMTLFRIYQGALSNVVRHAEARNVYIRFDLSAQEAVLEVEDNGKGFTLPRNLMTLAREHHYGLLGITEWAESIGGTLTVRSATGEGTRVHVRVPLEPEQRRPLLTSSLERLRTYMRRS